MTTACTSPLSEVADIVRGVTFDKGEAVDIERDGYMPVLRAGNIDGDLVTDRDLVWVPRARIGPNQRLQVGDIAICMSSGSLRIR